GLDRPPALLHPAPRTPAPAANTRAFQRPSQRGLLQLMTPQAHYATTGTAAGPIPPTTTEACDVSTRSTDSGTANCRYRSVAGEMAEEEKLSSWIPESHSERAGQSIFAWVRCGWCGGARTTTRRSSSTGTSSGYRCWRPSAPATDWTGQSLACLAARSTWRL